MLTQIVLSLLCSVFLVVKGYPNGAPPGICTLDMVPNHHSLPAQTSEVPFDLSISKDRVTSLTDQIIVTIKSRANGPSFKGFLVWAVDKNGAAVGTWVNDDMSHPLQECSATTQDHPTEKREVNLVWKPQDTVPDGPLTIKATVLQRFDTFWVKIPISAKGGAGSTTQELSRTTDETTNPSTIKSIPKGGVGLPGLAATSQSSISGTSTAGTTPQTTVGSSSVPSTVKISVSETSSVPSSSVPPSTKRPSIIKRLFGTGGNSASTSGSTGSSQANTEAIRKIDTPIETTTVQASSTSKPGLFKRLFGGK